MNRMLRTDASEQQRSAGRGPQSRRPTNLVCADYPVKLALPVIGVAELATVVLGLTNEHARPRRFMIEVAIHTPVPGGMRLPPGVSVNL
jgi:hypothetical protein